MWGFLKRKKGIEDIRDGYVLVVKFTRSLGDDLKMAQERHPNMSDHDALLRQFCDELQAGYDIGGMSGHFQVLRVNGRSVNPEGR